jgi:hypothetical protein
VLRWSASTDNSGLIGSYAVYANGNKIRTLASAARSVDLGRFRTTDSRRFRMRAYDAAGNRSRLTYKVAIVPAVRNLMLSDAKTRIANRGFDVGSISRAYSSTVGAGRVISTPRSGVFRTGTRIPLKVSLGSSNRTSTSGGSGTTGTTGTGSTTGTPGSNGYVPQPPPAPYNPAGGTPQPPAPAPAPTDGTPGGSEGGIVTTAGGLSQPEDSWLRRALGLALLFGAFLAAAVALARSRNRQREQVASVPQIEPVLFWDTRLLHLATSAVRRLAGRA